MAERLHAEGWQVLARNWIGGGGELDLVVARGDALRFVEVKLRADPAFAEDALSVAKQARLRSAAAAWLASRGEWRGEQAFLVVWVDGEALRFVDDAFDG